MTACRSLLLFLSSGLFFRLSHIEISAVQLVPCVVYAVVTRRPPFFYVHLPAGHVLTKFTRLNFCSSCENYVKEVLVSGGTLDITILGDDSECNTFQCGVRGKGCLSSVEKTQSRRVVYH